MKNCDGRFRAEYVIEKAVWGDLYKIIVYETHFNSPGFAPDEYESKLCEVWTKYSNWQRRIEWQDTTCHSPQALKFILKEFTGKLNEKKYKRLEINEKP